jgi:hypothetical protein
LGGVCEQSMTCPHVGHALQPLAHSDSVLHATWMVKHSQLAGLPAQCHGKPGIMQTLGSFTARTQVHTEFWQA